MKKYISGLASQVVCFTMLSFACVAPVAAQTVGTIGLGDVVFDSSMEIDAQSKANIVSAVTVRLNEALNKTRKFTVLPYSELTAKLQKQGLNVDGYYNKTYSGPEFYQAGLDYILTAKVTEFGLFMKSPTETEDAIALFEVDFTLHGVADRTVDFSSNISSQVSRRTANVADDVTNQLLDQAIQKGVDNLVSKMIAAVFPLNVVRIDESGNIMLNYGDGLLVQGDTILIYPSGEAVPIEAIKNDDNASGNPIATLQIVSTDTRFSVAQALSGADQLIRGQKGKLLASGL